MATIVGASAAGANLNGFGTSTTVTLAAPSGTADGDLMVITASMHILAPDPSTITGSVSISDYTSISSYGVAPYGSAFGNPRSWHTRSTAGVFATGDAPYVVTFSVDSPVYFDGIALCNATVTALRGVDTWTSASSTYNRSDATWALGSGTSAAGVFGVIARPEVSGAFTLVSAGTTTTTAANQHCRFWDLDAGAWTLPTVDADAAPPGNLPGHAVWLRLNPPTGGGLVHGHPIGAGFSGLVAVR